MFCREKILVSKGIERFSNDSRKTKTKAVTSVEKLARDFYPISKRSKGNSNRVITFDSHLKTVLYNM